MPVTAGISGLRFGYASQNLTLPATTGRTMRLSNIRDADRTRSLVEANLRDLEAILLWNQQHAMGLFRLSQQLIPFASHFDFPYDWHQEHAADSLLCALHGRQVDVMVEAKGKDQAVEVLLANTRT